MGLNLEKEDGLYSFGIKVRKEELVLPPSFGFILDHQFNNLTEIPLYNMPEIFVKMDGKAIRARSFVWLHLPDCRCDLHFLYVFL